MPTWWFERLLIMDDAYIKPAERSVLPQIYNGEEIGCDRYELLASYAVADAVMNDLAEALRFEEQGLQLLGYRLTPLSEAALARFDALNKDTRRCANCSEPLTDGRVLCDESCRFAAIEVRSWGKDTA